MEKSIFDYKGVKSVTAICLLKDGQRAGKIIANWSDNPAGSVCTAAVILYKHPTKPDESFNNIGKAGGYGYDKLSSAIEQALYKDELNQVIKVKGGSGNQREAFESAGYEFIEII